MESFKFFYSKLFILSLLIVQTSCTALFFHPIKEHVLSPDDYNISYRDVFFNSTEDLKLHGWWFPAESSSKAVVIYLQGNSGNVSTHAIAAYWLTKHNYDVFIFDYRGYGKSEGVAFLQGALNDVEQAILYAAQHNESDKKIFVIGQSLGASMGVFAASKTKENIDGAVFVSPFSDYREIAQEMLSKSKLTWALQWPLSFTINNDYRPLDYVSKVAPVPTLFLYSDGDEVVPSDQTKALYEKATQPKALEKLIGSHNTIMGIQENRDIILKYLDEWSR